MQVFLLVETEGDFHLFEFALEDETPASLATPQIRAALRRVAFTDSAECPVCLCAHGNSAAELPCGHSFHAQCIERWLRISANCPMCRTAV
jgi:hypothetical protein